MSISKKKRMAGNFEIIHALHIGDREVVLGQSSAGVGGESYMCAFCLAGGLLACYTGTVVSSDYAKLVKLFGERVAEQAEKTRIALNGPKLQGIPDAPITAEGCEVIGPQHDLKGKVVVIKPEVLRPEYRRATSQLHLCNRDFGASPGSQDSACSCTELYSGKTSCFDRSDILGTIAPEKLPEWAKHYLESIQQARQAEKKAKERDR